MKYDSVIRQSQEFADRRKSQNGRLHGMAMRTIIEMNEHNKGRNYERHISSAN